MVGIHCRRGLGTLLCVQFSGKSKKQAGIIDADEVEMLLASLELCFWMATYKPKVITQKAKVIPSTSRAESGMRGNGSVAAS